MKFVKVPLINGLNKTKGCEFTPEKILIGKDFEKILFGNDDLEKANKIIYEKAFELLKENFYLGFVGGDHSVSYPLTRAFFDFCENYGKEPCLIVFDAHSDCMKPVDKNFPTHEEWLRGLIEDGFPIKNILLVGARNLDKEEIKFLKEKNIKQIPIKNFIEDLNGTIESIMEFANNKELYVSIDIDFIDPVFAPATGYLEEGGLSSKEFLYILERINKMKNLKVIDLVEINALMDEKFDNRTIKLGKAIVNKFLN